MKYLLMALLAVTLWVPQQAQAWEDWRLYTGAWSQHFQNRPGDNGPYESNHNLIAIEYKGFQLGYLRNSFKWDTVFAGYGKEHRPWKHLALVAVIGVNYGYSDCFKGYASDGDHRKEVCLYVLGGAYYTKYAAQPGLLLNSQMIAANLRWELDYDAIAKSIARLW